MNLQESNFTVMEENGIVVYVCNTFFTCGCNADRPTLKMEEHGEPSHLHVVTFFHPAVVEPDEKVIMPEA